jgi:hypothetical protein
MYSLTEVLKTGQMEQSLNFECGISGYTPKLTNGENRVNLTSQLELMEIIKFLLPRLICCNINVITQLSTAFLHKQFLPVLLFSLYFAKLLTNSIGQIVIPKAQLRGALIGRSKISHHSPKYKPDQD